MDYLQSENQIIVRLVRGEKVVESLKQIATELNIKGGFLIGLGALEQTTLGYFSITDKIYHKKTFEDSLEITNFTGNFSYFENELIIHAHVTLSDQEMQTFGGHFFEGTVSGTFEAIIIPSLDLIREKDKELNLNLLKLPHILPKS